MHHVVLEDLIATVEAATERRDRLTRHIERVLADWSLAPVVRALQALVNAATLVAELGDITRFTNPRHLMAYLGLVPSEQSSGERRRQGGITKAGNGAARRMLIEAAWSYRFPARVSRALLLRQEGLAKAIRVERTAAALSPLSQAGPYRQARNRGHHRRCPRAGRLCLGHCRSGTRLIRPETSTREAPAMD